eukprot:gene14231-15714_t
MSRKKVAIIGAGPSGLCSIKAAVEEGFDVVCFEQESIIGGLWHYTEKDSHSSVCKSTVINTSKEMMSYSDFPAPKEFPIYMHNTKVMEYLSMYAKEFDLIKYVKFCTKIKMVKKCPDFDVTGKWEITYHPVGKEIVGEKSEVFDFVFVCTGHHWLKNVPHFEGIENFKGTVIHSKQYKTPSRFEDKVVLVIGIGNSGGDISVELSRHASQVYLSTRRGSWVFSRMTKNGYPGDQYKNRRCFGLIPSWLQAKMGEHVANSRFDHEKFGLKPQHSVFQQHPMVNDDLPVRMAAGRLIVKSNVKLIKETSVVFDDDTEIHGVDTIILATGYKIGFPCVDESIIKVSNNQVPLYKYMFPYELSKNTMAIIGCFQPIGSIMPMSELQARWAVKVFNGEKQLPSCKEMEADVMKKRKEMAGSYYQSERHTIQVDYMNYSDEIAEQIGCKPNLRKLFLTDPSLALLCFFGPCAPYQYRLDGPNTWSGAKKALQSINDNIIYPTKTRLHAQQTFVIYKALCETRKVGGYARVIFAFVAFYFMPTSPVIATSFYVTSGLLDAFDGYAARALGQASRFGAVLDMLTDRCATTCLLVVLAYFYPAWMLMFQFLISLDIASHWAQMYSSLIRGSSSHKNMEEKTHPLLKLYYTSRPVLFVMCAGNELFYTMLYLLYFGNGPTLSIATLDIGLWKLLAVLCFPVCAVKNLISIVQMIGAFEAINKQEAEEKGKLQQ